MRLLTILLLPLTATLARAEWVDYDVPLIPYESVPNFLKYSPEMNLGEILGMLGESGRQLGQFNWLHGIDCSQEGVLYIADLNNWRVQKLILNP